MVANFISLFQIIGSVTTEVIMFFDTTMWSKLLSRTFARFKRLQLVIIEFKEFLTTLLLDTLPEKVVFKSPIAVIFSLNAIFYHSLAIVLPNHF